MKFGILGPLEVGEGSHLIHLAPRPKLLLARLLVEANRAVPTDRLIDDLWPDHAPGDGEGALQNLVFRLRRAFVEAVDGDEVVITRAPGYVVMADFANLDAARLGRPVVGPRPAG